MKELLDIMLQDSFDIQKIFETIVLAARGLGFEKVAYGLRNAYPLSNPQGVVMLNNYPPKWRQRYSEASYFEIDPTVTLASQSRKPIVWDGNLFSHAQTLWDEANAFGLKVGWARSSRDEQSVLGMLTLVRSSEPLTERELKEKEKKMDWLAHISHMVLARLYRSQNEDGKTVLSLTSRELEVLKWTADGKSSQDIADILAISTSTVDFHVKNAMTKMQTANRTATVIRAAMLGYLR